MTPPQHLRQQHLRQPRLRPALDSRRHRRKRSSDLEQRRCLPDREPLAECRNEPAAAEQFGVDSGEKLSAMALS
jgi:hypothetical protein